MYYNMRIKTLKRNTSNVVRRASEAMQGRVDDLNARAAVIERRMRDVADVFDRSDVAMPEGGGGGGGVGEALSQPRRVQLTELYHRLSSAAQACYAEVAAIKVIDMARLLC
jgi:hypothetical protein